MKRDVPFSELVALIGLAGVSFEHWLGGCFIFLFAIVAAVNEKKLNERDRAKDQP